MKKKLIIGLMVSMPFFYVACTSGNKESASTETPAETTETTEAAPSEDYDPSRGEGKYDSANVTLGALNADMAKNGKSHFER